VACVGTRGQVRAVLLCCCVVDFVSEWPITVIASGPATVASHSVTSRSWQSLSRGDYPLVVVEVHLLCGLILLCCAGVYGDWGGDWVDERWVKHKHASAVKCSHTAPALALALCSLCVVLAAQKLPLLALVSLAQPPQLSGWGSSNCVHMLAPCTQVRPATDSCSILWPASMTHACPGPGPPSALHAYWYGMSLVCCLL
jgi:hypothetical protein